MKRMIICCPATHALISWNMKHEQFQAMKLNDVWYQVRLRCSLQGGHEPWCARHQQDLSETNILRSGGWMCLWESDHVMTHENFNPICFGWNCVSKNCVYIHVYVIANEDSKILISLFPSWFFCTEATKNHAASLQTRWHHEIRRPERTATQGELSTTLACQI